MIEKIAVIGCGFIGRAWTITFARAGHQVRLYDVIDGAAAAAVTYIEGVLSELEGKDLLMGASPADVLARIRIANGLEDALSGATYVQENTPEVISSKKDIFSALASIAAADTILASSTSALLPSSFSEEVEGRSRCLVVHPVNPPYLVPAVEIVPAPWTSPDIVARAEKLMRGIGQSPIVMKKEIDGFVINRLQGAFLQEAFRLYEDGYVGADDIDIGVRDGLGLRWSFMGPFETIDLNAPNGVSDYIARYAAMYAQMAGTQDRVADWSASSEKLAEEASALRPREWLAQRQVWRDMRLMALLAHKREAEKTFGK